MPVIPPPPNDDGDTAFAQYNEQLRRLIPLTDDQLLMMARRYLMQSGQFSEFHIPPGMVMLTDAGLLEVLRDVAGRGWRSDDPNVRRFGESVTDDELATIVDTGGANVFEGDVARIAAELLARRAGSSSRG